ncbi:MAG: methyl-accepting chemotaxis protein [Gammaproteobacteria bacterium]|nr:methyl-accepting chemotaxis protein [Gammaproteobacteria bacterium]
MSMLRSLKNISLKKTFTLLTGVLLLLVIAETVIISQVNNTVLHSSENIEHNELAILNKSHQSKLAVIQVQQWLTDISATRAQDGLNDGFDQAKQNAERFRKLIAELSQLDAEKKDFYLNMLPTFELYYLTGQKMAQAYIDGGPAMGNKMMAEFDAVAADMAKQIDQLLKQTNLHVINTFEAEIEHIKNGQVLYLGGMLLIIFGIVFCYLVLIRAINFLPIAIKEISMIAEGDLTSQYTSNRYDEMGELLVSVEKMRHDLITMISQIMQTNDSLTGSAGDMMRLTNDNNAAANLQQNETDQIATAINQLSATAQDVSQNVTLTADTVNHANNETQAGKKVVESAIIKIQSVANKLEQAASVIQQLESDTASITGILDVIKGIAEQTNLLALNAAIEAARAGDQGRGFAVVADEVRALARRTQDSTEEIGQMIESLTNGAREAVEVTTTSREEAREAADNAAEATQSLEAIADAVENIRSMSQQIAEASTQQTQVTEEVNMNIVKVRDMAVQMVDNVAFSMKASEEVAQNSDQLSNMVKHFKL